MVLLQENSIDSKGNLLSGEFRTDNVFNVRPHCGVESWVLPIRALIRALLCDRSRPVWQGLLLVASLCSRLDGIGTENVADVPVVLRRYDNALGQGPSSELEKLHPEVATRVGLAVTLSNERSRDPDCSDRFRSVFWDFVEGIGSTGSEGPDADVCRFRKAHVELIEPVLSRSPFLMENYLSNYVYQHAFPFGRSGSDRFIGRSMFEEAVVLITQFSWLTTLLTGAAGHCGQNFSHGHIITAVQSFTRAVEHSPHILQQALALVVSQELDNLAGLAKLLRP